MFINLERNYKDKIWTEKILFPVNDTLNLMDCKYSLFCAIRWNEVNDEFYCYIMDRKCSNEWYWIQDSLSRKSDEKELENEKCVCVLCYDKL